jgi:hypothetical protein
MGVEADIVVNEFASVNGLSGSTVPLSPALGTLQLKRAQENPKMHGVTTVALNETNSNIDALLENKPTGLRYDLNLHVNPDGNKYNYQDFVHYDQTLEASLDMEVPLSLSADHLTLQDTFDFDFRLAGTAAGVQSATLYFLVDNGFPLDAEVQVYFADVTGIVLDSLFATSSVVAGGDLDNATCRVNEPKRTRLTATIDADRFDMLDASSHAFVRVMFTTTSTPGCTGPLKIYSDYDLGFKLTGRFNYYTGGPS